MSSTVIDVSRGIEDRLRFETMLADLSSRFVNLEPADVDSAIEEAQRTVCECLGLDIAALWQLCPDDPGVFEMTHIFRAVEGPPVPENFDAREVNPWALAQIFEGQNVLLPTIEQAPPEAARDLETWQYFDIKSVFCFPLIIGSDSVIGAISYHAVQKECSWPAEIVQRLGLVSQVFANAIVRKRADAELRQSEERLQLAADAADMGMWMLDVEAGQFWATDQAREIFRYEPDTEITIKRFMDSVQSNCRESVAEAVRLAIDEGREIDIEYRILRTDGVERWVHSRGRLQPASATAPVTLIGATVDVTDRHSADEELRLSYEEVQKLRHQLELENAYLKHEHRLQHGTGRIVGESPAIMRVLEMVEQVAPTSTTVLVEGETGTGKELVAQRIHELSPRSERPLVKVNCAALPSTLVESELFGREKGAYTGAVSREPGRFEVANGSTILLDEIAELPLELQAKLLRVLEEGQFERVGSSRTQTTDVRVIAATNRDLRAEIEAGRFRRDLFFRLAVFPITVPPLRERRGDIPLLVWAIVQELGAAMNKVVETIRRDDMERLQSYDWAGNVRELRNVIERALILCSGPVLRISLPDQPLAETDGLMSLDEAQRRHIEKALRTAGGRISGPGGAAELLGVKRTTLRSRMQKLGVDPASIRDDGSPS